VLHSEHSERQLPDRIQQFLADRIPPILAAQLSRRELMSISDKPFFADILAKSVANVVNSILVCLQFTPSDAIANAHIAELSRAAHPGEREVPAVAIDVDSVTQAADMMLMRCRTISAFFTKEPMPLVFTDRRTVSSQSILRHPIRSHSTFWLPIGSSGSDFRAVAIVRLARAISLDDFSVYAQQKLTSSSVTDLFTIQASFAFTKGLRFSREEINISVMAYSHCDCGL
jgi:hypothetical protein